MCTLLQTPLHVMSWVLTVFLLFPNVWEVDLFVLAVWWRYGGERRDKFVYWLLKYSRPWNRGHILISTPGMVVPVKRMELIHFTLNLSRTIRLHIELMFQFLKPPTNYLDDLRKILGFMSRLQNVQIEITHQFGKSSPICCSRKFIRSERKEHLY